MVQLMIGHKGSGKTKTMIELANASVDTAKGNILTANYYNLVNMFITSLVNLDHVYCC